MPNIEKMRVKFMKVKTFDEYKKLVIDKNGNYTGYPDVVFYIEETKECWVNGISYSGTDAITQLNKVLTDMINTKQETLVSGKNIKTINNNSLLVTEASNTNITLENIGVPNIEKTVLIDNDQTITGAKNFTNKNTFSEIEVGDKIVFTSGTGQYIYLPAPTLIKNLNADYLGGIKHNLVQDNINKRLDASQSIPPNEVWIGPEQGPNPAKATFRRLVAGDIPPIDISTINGIDEALNKKSDITHIHSWDSLTNKPKTVAEAGLLDAITSTVFNKGISLLEEEDLAIRKLITDNYFTITDANTLKSELLDADNEIKTDLVTNYYNRATIDNFINSTKKGYTDADTALDNKFTELIDNINSHIVDIGNNTISSVKGSNSIQVDKLNDVVVINSKVSSDNNMLKIADDGLLVNGKLAYDNLSGMLHLQNTDGIDIGEPVNLGLHQIIETGKLETIEGKTYIVLKFIGVDDEIKINVNKLIDVYTASNGIKETNRNFSIDIHDDSRMFMVIKDSKLSISPLLAKVDESSSSLESIQKDIDINKENINTNKTNIVNLTSVTIPAIDKKIIQNATDIKTNVDNITANKNSIVETNKNVTTNKNSIGTINTKLGTIDKTLADYNTRISNNTSNITANKTSIDTVTSLANTNKTNIATNTSNIATNKTNIATNTSGVAANKKSIADLTTKVNANTSGIDANKKSITDLTTKVNANTSGVSTNKNSITDLTNKVNTNTSNIATNKSGIDTNKSSIANLTTKVNVNTSDIASNKSNITKVENATNLVTKYVTTAKLSNGTKCTIEGDALVIPAGLGEGGEKGDKGDKGDQGPIGPQGPKGDTGPKGAQGERGAQGPKGDVGSKGATGAAGKNGVNAYTHIKYSVNATGSGMVDNPTASTIYMGVYSGTSSTAPTATSSYKWFKTQGPQGVKGATGAKGNTGATGKDGFNPRWKTTGSTILVASNGERDLKGPKGDTGAKGADGARGPQGTKGATGATGATGAKGDKGDTGPRGPKGDKGDTPSVKMDGYNIVIDGVSTNIRGPKGADGKDGAPGKDGVDGSFTNINIYGHNVTASTTSVRDSISNVNTINATNKGILNVNSSKIVVSGQIDAVDGFFQQSDRNVKENIEPIMDSQSRQIEIIKFNYLDDIYNKNHYGVIAQDVEKVYPELVSKNDEGIKSVNYTELLLLMVDELRKDNEKLHEEIQKLKNK